MINIFISIFIAVLIGVGFIGPIANQVMTNAGTTNASGATCTYAVDSGVSSCQLYMASSWGSTVLKMIPGFYALVILGVVVGGLFAVFRGVGLQ